MTAVLVGWALISGPAGMGTGASKLASGQKLFRAHCAACHGPDGEGNTPLAKSMKAANLHSPEVQKKSNVQLERVISNGAGDMPSFKNSLTDDQIQALVSYLRAPSKKK